MTMAMMRTRMGRTVQAVREVVVAASVASSSSSAPTSPSSRAFSSWINVFEIFLTNPVARTRTWTVTSLSLTASRPAILVSASSKDCSRAEMEEVEECSRREVEEVETPLEECSSREEEEREVQSWGLRSSPWECFQ